MSQSTLATTGTTSNGTYSRTPTDAELDDVLSAFEDADSRRILSATSEEALSAKELAETCDLALSTTYRKLELLTDAGLLEEGLRLRKSGNHTAEYAARLDEYVLSVSPGEGVALRINEHEPAAGRF